MINLYRRCRWSIRSKIVNGWEISKFDKMVKICQILKFSSIGIVGFTTGIGTTNGYHHIPRYDRFETTWFSGSEPSVRLHQVTIPTGLMGDKMGWSPLNEVINRIDWCIMEGRIWNEPAAAEQGDQPSRCNRWTGWFIDPTNPSTHGRLSWGNRYCDWCCQSRRWSDNTPRRPPCRDWWISCGCSRSLPSHRVVSTDRLGW